MVKSMFTRQHKQTPRSRLHRPVVLTLWALGIFALLYVVTFNETLRAQGRLVDTNVNPTREGSIRKKEELVDDMDIGDNSLSPEERACRQLPESTEAFIQYVHDDIEPRSLPQWTSPDQKWRFPRLDMDLLNSAFGNKRVALLGDSTLFYMVEHLNPLLNMTNQTLLGELSDTTNMTDAYFKVGYESALHDSTAGWRDMALEPDWPIKAGGGHVFRYPSSGAQVMWTGFHGMNMALNCRFDEYVWPEIRKYRPDVLVANWGIHMFHHGHAYPKSLCLVDQFLRYQEWLQTVLNLAKEVGTKVLLFKTTNRICPEKYPQLLQDGVALQRNDTKAFMHNCVSTLERIMNDPMAPEHAILAPNSSHGYYFIKSELYHYCWEAVGGDEAAQRLNRHMKKFIAKAQQDPSNENLTIALYNDHDMERCEYTTENDGSHFWLHYPRIRLLSHMIQCLWNDPTEV